MAGARLSFVLGPLTTVCGVVTRQAAPGRRPTPQASGNPPLLEGAPHWDSGARWDAGSPRRTCGRGWEAGSPRGRGALRAAAGRETRPYERAPASSEAHSALGYPPRL